MGHAWFSSVIQTEVPKQTAWVETNQGTCLSTAGFRPFRKATPPSQFRTRTGTLAAAVARLTAVFALAAPGFHFPLSRLSTALIMAPHSVRAAVKSFAVRFVPLR